MRRELPAKPNLEHLKSQAKDLLDAHRRGEAEAFARIRAAVPAFAHRSDADIARAAFALHDAQSAIAREYGFASWAELRARLAAADADPASLLRTINGDRVPPELEARLVEALAQRGAGAGVATPPSVPALPLRNAVVFPGAFVPIDVSRASSLAAMEAALQARPAFVAVFAQRAIDIDQPTRDDLHGKGSLCILHLLERVDPAVPAPATEPGKPPRLASVILEGVRWIALDGLEQTEPYFVARVADLHEDGGDDDEVAALQRRLRELAHRFADTMTGVSDQVHAMIDSAAEPGRLANLVMAHFPMPVADMASYAEETQLPRKLDRAIALLDDQLAKVLAAPV